MSVGEGGKERGREGVISELDSSFGLTCLFWPPPHLNYQLSPELSASGIRLYNF